MKNVIVIFALLSACAQADVIRLKNGREIEGVIQGATATDVVIKVGPGLVTLRKSSIASLKKTGADQLEAKWRTEHYLHPKYVPAELEKVAGDFRNLQNLHREALAARAALDELPAQMQNLADELDRTQAAFRETRSKMNATDPRKDVNTYNALVTQHNVLNNRVLELQDVIKKLEPLKQKHAESIGKFLAGLTEFKALRQEALKKDYPPESPEQIFFTQLDRDLLPMEKNVEFSRIPYTEENNHAVMTAMLNGDTEARLLLDTGASYVSLSENMARRLGCILDTDSEFMATLADGSTVKAKPAVIQSVRIGDARVDRVPAMVLSKEPAPGVDGLLGMSFLREFNIHFDVPNRRLVLQRFKPQ